MLSRHLLKRQILHRCLFNDSVSTRCLATVAVKKATQTKHIPPATQPTSPPPPVAAQPPKPVQYKPPLQSEPLAASNVAPLPQSWLTRKVKESPAALKTFLSIAKLFGYGSPKQLAGRRAFWIYEESCIVRADEESEFWRNECHLPPTFQSWFTIMNLHIWLLTVRFRALPSPHGEAYVQGLIDHFFLDVEDRIRAVLQPSSGPNKPTPYTSICPFYQNSNTTEEVVDPKTGKKKPRGRAPDRLVTRQMKIFKEQWAGMGMAFDLGLVRGDMELAGAVWRNLLGARGARGIAYASPPPTAPKSETTTSTPQFRRSVNLVGGQVENPAKVDETGLEVEEAKDDYSGVHDFLPQESDKYVEYPEVMAEMVAYVRRELIRLEAVSDEEIMNGDVGLLAFGKVKGPW